MVTVLFREGEADGHSSGCFGHAFHVGETYPVFCGNGYHLFGVGGRFVGEYMVTEATGKTAVLTARTGVLTESDEEFLSSMRIGWREAAKGERT